RNRELDAFAGRVAHDLRGPLTTVSFAASRLSRKVPEAGGISEMLRKSVSRMDSLISDMLALARVTVADPNAVCDPVAAVKQVKEELDERLQKDDVVVRYELEPATVRCVESHLRQVLYNLTDNALKYRRPDVRSEVAIEGHTLQGRYELVVRDN